MLSYDVLIIGQKTIESQIKSRMKYTGRYLERLRTVKDYLNWCEAAKMVPIDKRAMNDAVEYYTEIINSELKN